MPIPSSEEQRYSRARPRLLALGWPQLAVVVAGVVLILGVAAVRCISSQNLWRDLPVLDVSAPPARRCSRRAADAVDSFSNW